MKLSVQSLGRHPKVALALVAMLMFQVPASAAVITVDLGDSTVLNDGLCSLREAITSANTDSVSGLAAGECPAGDAGLDTIQLGTNVDLTISDGNQFSSPTGLPLVESEITIEGNNNTIARAAGAPDFRIFAVALSGTLTLNDVRVTNGSLPDNYDSSGGGIRNEGTAALTNTTLSGNSANYGAGIASYSGTTTLTNSTLSGNSSNYGGGLRSFGTATLTNSTLSGNTARRGGGISIYGTVTLTNSTLSGNSSSYEGGGINNQGTVTLTNSTLSGNSAPLGGGISASPYSSGTSTLTNSIVANSSGGNCSGTIIDGSNNFADDATCGTVPSTLTLLDPNLASNGGPTQTHALLAGSSAIDAVACGLVTDQRGFLRNVGDCDSGAYEFGAAAPPAVPGLTRSGIVWLASLLSLGLLVTLLFRRRRVAI